MQRHTDTKTKIFPKPSEFVVVRNKSRRRMDEIAYENYEDAKLWWVIKAANPELEVVVEPGQTLKIPTSPQRYLSEVRRLNRTR